ncbi:MAG: hypothetical protein ABJB86_18815 [Bacteroidota bacterium]
MKHFLFITLLFIAFHSMLAQQTVQHPCSGNPVYRQFDFWIGQWEAFTTANKKAGDSKVSLLLDSCIVLEEWTSTQAGYEGKSFNTYNVGTGKWQQYWVDNRAGVTEYFDGHFENNTMILQTTNIKQADGRYKILKMSFFNLGTDKLRQFGQSSADNGKTWTTDFDLEYRRKK